MNRLDGMLERLPPLWRIESGSRLHDLMSIIAVVLTEFDQDMDRVQRAHWIDTTFARDDAEKLGALFDVDAAPWEDLPLYRTRLKATIAALLRGAVTPREIVAAVERVLAQGLDSLAIVRAQNSNRGVQAGRVRLREFPVRRRRSMALLERHGRLKPLDRFTCDHGGVEDTAVLGTIRGVRDHRTSVPTLVNLTTGDLLTYLGLLHCGEELSLRLHGERLVARHRGRDVTDRLITTRNFVPGTPLARSAADNPPRPLRLRPGTNDLWFVCLGIYDAPGFDGAGFQAPTTEVVQGVFAGDDPSIGTRFGTSLFHQQPAAIADLWWDEFEPARFRVDVPTAVVLREAPSPTAEAELDRLLELLDVTVTRLRAAAVDGHVQRWQFVEAAYTEDLVTVPLPEYDEQAEVTAALEALGALFDVTTMDSARYE